jgi:hypothetical protein
MTTKIVLVLSMSLNVMLAVVVLENNKKPVALAEFRDAVADTRASAELVPPPAAEIALADAAPAAATMEEPAPPRAVIVANDWTAYRQEMADDRDVLVSNVFRSERNGEKAMNAAVNRLLASGKDVLFSCLMPATGGGTFYLIRLVPAATEIPRLPSMADIASKDYIKEVQLITDRTEKEVWGSI